MDSTFFDDCGLEGYDYFSNELDGVRKEYFVIVSDKNGDRLDLSEGIDSEVFGVVVDDIEVLSFIDFGI